MKHAIIVIIGLIWIVALTALAGPSMVKATAGAANARLQAIEKITQTPGTF